jgi:adenine deaminase
MRHYRIKAGTAPPGEPADFIITDDPKTMNILETWIDGECVFRNGQTFVLSGRGRKSKQIQMHTPPARMKSESSTRVEKSM